MGKEHRVRGQGSGQRVLTLPEGQKDDRLDHEELEHGPVGAEQLPGGEVEEEEGVEGQADRDIVDDGDVKVAAGDAVEERDKGIEEEQLLTAPVFQIVSDNLCSNS